MQPCQYFNSINSKGKKRRNLISCASITHIHVLNIQCSAAITRSFFFKKNIHKRHFIARPLLRRMGFLLCIQHLIDIVSEFLQSFMQYRIKFDRIITGHDCIWISGYCLIIRLYARVFVHMKRVSVIKIPANNQFVGIPSRTLHHFLDTIYYYLFQFRSNTKPPC